MCTLSNIKKHIKNGELIRNLYDNRIYTANDTHIGFEICEDDLTNASYFNLVYKEAIDLCVYLCKLYDLTEENIICHCEGYKQGIASNHADVMYWFPKHGKSMDSFRLDVAKILSELEQEEPIPRYVVPGLVRTKAIYMSDMVSKLTAKFSKEKDISQREVVEGALIEYLQKYGFKREIKTLLKNE